MIKLEHIVEKDYKDVIKYITNSKVSKFLSWNPYCNENDIVKYLEYTKKSICFPDEIFSIFWNNNFIGTAHILKKSETDIQIGFGMFPEFWNRGFGLQIVNQILFYIKNSDWTHSTKRILAVIHKDNIYAERIFLKLDFVLEKREVKKNFNRYILLVK